MPTLYLDRPDAPRLAYRTIPPGTNTTPLPGVLFLCGLKSDMLGTKAEFLADRCAVQGQAFTRFDYRGHGQSAGEFSVSLLSEWLDDTLAIFDSVTAGNMIVVGSSLGGWLGLLLAERRPERVRGFIGIAAAPDFTRLLLPPGPDQNYVVVPSAYSDTPFHLAPNFIDDAALLCWLKHAHALNCPVRLLHGQQDAEVSWQTAEQIRVSLPNADFSVTLIPDGDHRLSRPADLSLLDQTLCELTSACI